MYILQYTIICYTDHSENKKKDSINANKIDKNYII